MNRAKIVAQRIVGDLGQRSGKFHAGGARAHDHKGQPAAPALGIGFAFGGFKREEDLMTHAGGVLERLEAGRDRLPSVVTEKEVARSRGDDQRIVRNEALVEN